MRLALMLTLGALLAACSREPIRTVVLDPVTGRPAIDAPAAARSPTARGPAAPASAAASVAGATAPRAPTAPPAPIEGPLPQPAAPARQPPVGASASEPIDSLLAGRQLLLPVEGIAPTALRDNFNEMRASRRHEAIDIMAARGTRVLAVDDGKLVKLFTSAAGGLTVYQFGPQNRIAYYYAHLDRYAAGLKEGAQLRRGDLIGYVGSSGNASPDAPHLHFAIFRLGPLRQWWRGEPLNPYPVLGGNAALAGAAR